MKKQLLLLISIFIVSACSSKPEKSPVDDRDLMNKLMHHTFVLTHVDGEKIISNSAILRNDYLAFNETFFVEAQLCKSIAGQGVLIDHTLRIPILKKRKINESNCHLAKAESLLMMMLKEGAKVSLVGNQLTLSHQQHQLIFNLRDWMM